MKPKSTKSLEKDFGEEFLENMEKGLKLMSKILHLKPAKPTWKMEELDLDDPCWQEKGEKL